MARLCSSSAGFGRRHGGRTVTALIHGLDNAIIDATTVDLPRELAVDRTRHHQPQNGKKPEPSGFGPCRYLEPITLCPRQDSNLRPRLRRAVLYPLSYGGLRMSRTEVPDGRRREDRGYQAARRVREST